MERSTRISNPGLVDQIQDSLRIHRDELVESWLAWIERRTAAAPATSRPVLYRQLRLLLDVLALMAGPLRREATNLWFNASELYGRTAAIRGLATGEVVEELQHLRELLIRSLGDTLAGMGPRQVMATVLRLNRALDKAIADAVVGYTDALIVTLFAQNGVPVPVAEPQQGEMARQLDALEAELTALAKRA